MLLVGARPAWLLGKMKACTVLQDERQKEALYCIAMVKRSTRILLLHTMVLVTEICVGKLHTFCSLWTAALYCEQDLNRVLQMCASDL